MTETTTDSIVTFLLARFADDDLPGIDVRRQIMADGLALCDQGMLTLRTLAMPYMDHPDFDPGWSTL